MTVNAAARAIVSPQPRIPPVIFVPADCVLVVALGVPVTGPIMLVDVIGTGTFVVVFGAGVIDALGGNSETVNEPVRNNASDVVELLRAATGIDVAASPLGSAPNDAELAKLFHCCTYVLGQGKAE